MAIYIALSPLEFEYISSHYSLGRVLSTQGVPQGSINSNFFLTATQGCFFVRHTTVRTEDELEVEASLLEHLQRRGIPSPRMLRVGGTASIPLGNGRVCVFNCLEGSEKNRDNLTPQNAFHVGLTLAQVHLASVDFPMARKNPYSVETVAQWLEELRGQKDSELSDIAHELIHVLDSATQTQVEKLPTGTIHADLFMDNVKWVGEQISAVFDFEMACLGEWVYDLAICLNAWCFRNGYLEPYVQHFLQGYESVRRLTFEERQALPSRLELSAVRFTASRIRDFHLSKVPSDHLTKKDFRTYLARVRVLKEMPHFIWNRWLKGA